jgi:hypothetical protein
MTQDSATICSPPLPNYGLAANWLFVLARKFLQMVSSPETFQFIIEFR